MFVTRVPTNMTRKLELPNPQRRLLICSSNQYEPHEHIRNRDW
jgi:hypothetical protein